MAKNNNKYRVPIEEVKDYKLLVQRANRRIQKSLQYIQDQNIKEHSTIRALVSDYSDSKEWTSEKIVFSGSVKFESKKDYEDYKKHISEWGSKGKNSEDYERNPEQIRKGYEKAIIKALTTTAIENGDGAILTKNGRLPYNLAKRIKNMTLEQLTNFFSGGGDPTEDIESARFDSYEYLGVDRETFVSITEARLNSLEELYPDNRPKEQKTIQKNKSKSNKKKSKRRKKSKRKLRRKR